MSPRESLSSENKETLKHKNSSSLRKQLSTDETKRPTLLDEASTIVDVKPVDNNETEM